MLLNHNLLAVVVMTSDRYFSLLDGFIYFFQRNSVFNGCDVYFGCENLTRKDYDKFHFIQTNEFSWSKRLHLVLDKIPHENVILLLDDFFFLLKEEHESIESVVRQFVNSDYDSLRIINLKEDNLLELSSLENTNFLLESFDKKKYKNDQYFISTGTFYKTLSLKNILRINENAWEFEVNGSFRAKLNKYYSIASFDGLNKFTFGYPHTGIIARGKLIKKYHKDISNQGFTLKWEDLEINAVTTEDTPLIIRFLRIPPRYIKKYINIYFNKLY